MSAGQSLLFYVDFNDLVGSSLYASAIVKSINFEIAETSPVPLPAGFPLLLFGIGALGLMRRRKTRRPPHIPILEPPAKHPRRLL